MALTIDELNIQIAADSKNATRAINNLAKSFERLNKAATPILNTNVQLSNSFNKASTAAEKNAKSVKKSGDSAKKSATSFAQLKKNLLMNILTARTFAGVLMGAANTMANMWNESNEYIETMNLFRVTMGDASDEALKYAKNVSKAMGIDIADWMQYQGTFKNLTAGFGVASDKANIMSQNLTQLTYDLASFHNRKVETAFDKLSSAMAGQVKGLRDFGIDVTVASLQEYALSKGIDASVRSMSQAEKAMLRYNYIMEKSILMQGDMARTILTPANALRVLTAQFKQMRRAMGNIISVIAVQFIPYVQALVQIITEAATAIAKFFGFSEEDFEADLSGLSSGFSGEFEEAEDNLGGVSNKIKKIKKQLMGFDELNIINAPDTDSGGGSGGASVGGAGLDLKPLEYDFLKGLKTEKLDEIKSKLETALKIVGAIGIAFGTWKIANGIVSVFNTFSALSGVFTTIQTAIAGSGLVAFFSNLGFAIQAVVGGAATFGEAIVFVFQGAAGIISGALLGITGLIGYFKNLVDIVKNGENATNVLKSALGGLTASAGAFLIAVGAGATVATAGIAALVVGAVAAVGIITALVYNNWDKIKAFFAPFGDWFKRTIVTPVMNFFAPVKEAFNEVKNYAVTKFTELKDGVIARIVPIWNKIVEIKNKVVEIFSALWGAFKELLWNPMVKKLGAFYKEYIKPIVDKFKTAFEFVRDIAIGVFKGIGKSVVDVISGAFKGVMNGIFYSIESKINSFIRMLNSAIYLINKIPGVNISTVSEISIPRFATGGFPDMGQMFIARESGPELVGNIGRKTAVANNDQIISGIESGVYRAMVAANSMKQGGSQTIRIVNEIDGDIVGEKVIKYHNGKVMQTGVSPLLV
jgi:hypothetical protein